MENNFEILDLPTQSEKNPGLYLADSGKRIANFILDRILMYVFIFFLAFLLEALTPTEAAADYSGLIFGFIFMLCIPGYYIIPEMLWGKTPAKFITKTTVVDLYGNKIGFPKALGRTLCRFIPFEVFSFLGANAVGWHDTIPGTRVVTDDYFLD